MARDSGSSSVAPRWLSRNWTRFGTAAVVLVGCGGVTPSTEPRGDGGTPTAPESDKSPSSGGADTTGARDAASGATGPMPPTVTIRPADDGEVVVIGRLGRNGVAHCTAADPYTRTWTGVNYRVGLMPIDLPKGFDVSHLKPGWLVVTRGRLPDPATPFESLVIADPAIPEGATSGECGVYQMRDDWRETPDGIVRDEPGLTPFERLRITSLEPWVGLSARVLDERPDELQVKLLGVGASEIPNLEITAHYEGCYGKPGSMETSTSITLPREGPATVGFPLVAAEPPQEALLREHILESLRIVGSAEDIHFALSVPLHELGIENECSARRDTRKAQPKVSRDPDWKADEDRNEAK